ncbi:hypothetical protein [Vibrio neptunius]|uniref:hypothetical protein n=1 Tax=Vibrio neptunius TaxID=170651 RepID=UPI0019D0E0E9|nr:hypothetical protein [Vibrio neptunius]MBN3574317.1 hypothetical protein [Vibrio neptunius]QXX08931.1 hypothetical protein KW548_17625 [Vibrio neptunius]
MIEKEIYELTRDDLKQYPIWYFPMDDTVDDELTIRPFDGDCQTNDCQVIARTVFFANDGSEYMGYIYWNNPNNVEDVKPVVFVNNEDCVTFWNGIVEANWSDYGEEQKELRSKLPLKYSSETVQGLESLSGKLEGLYYFEDENIAFKP